MKRLLFIITSIILFSSCGFDDGSGTTTQYTLTATFQYKGVAFRPDSTFVNTSTPKGFGYDALNFFHKLDADNIWFDGGFIMSCAEMPASGVTEGLMNTYRANLNKAVNKNQKGNIYTVFYQNPDNALMPEHDVEFAYDMDNGSTCNIIGCFITNTVEVADYIKENFTVGDKMTIKATGYLDGAKTGEAEFVLAEYSAQKDSIVSRWTMFDLEKLGSVEYVDFEVSSTKPDTPTYFCMDSMGAEIKLIY